jgi:glycosyltransferase involved in cell wall biosynthesis
MSSIWIVKHYAADPSLPGSIRQYEFARGLAERGHDVTLFVSGFNHRTKQYIRDFRAASHLIEPEDGFKIVWIKGFPYYKNDWRRVADTFSLAIKFWKIAGRIAGREVSRPEVILANSVPLFLPFAAYLASRKFKARFVLEVADIWPQGIADMGVISEHNPLFGMLKRCELFLYRKAHKIISPLPMFESYLAAIGLRDKAAFVGRSTDMILRDFSGNGRKPSNRFQLCYIGGHGPTNDLDLAIRAFDELQRRGIDNIELTIVGDGIEKPRLMEESRRLGLDCIRFENAVPNFEIPKYLCKADAFLWIGKPLSVHRYGIFPNKLADYLAAGRPIIRFGRHPKSIIDQIGCGITVGSDEPEVLADELVKLAALPSSARDEMGYRGRAFAEENLTLAKVSQSLADALRVA